MTKLTPEQEMTEFLLKYPTPDREPSMINEELIAQAREFLRRRNFDLRQIMRIYPKDTLMYDEAEKNFRLVNTHLAEMEEHGADEEGICSNRSCEYAKSPCKPLLTKAKRLLGVE